MFERSPALNETFVTVVGNLVDDPKLRTLDAGQDVASFRIASTSRRFDRDGQRWVDAGQLFLGVTCWRELAGNAAASLRRGDPVIVSGKLSTRTYEKDGQNRSVCELEALAVGPDLARGTAVFRRTPRTADEPAGAVADPAAGESRLVGAGV
jgi:single-strand DNA-binding protein